MKGGNCETWPQTSQKNEQKGEQMKGGHRETWPQTSQKNE